MVRQEVRPIEVQHLVEPADARGESFERTEEKVDRAVRAQVFAQGRTQRRSQSVLADSEEVARKTFGGLGVGVAEKLS